MVLISVMSGDTVKNESAVGLGERVIRTTLVSKTLTVLDTTAVIAVNTVTAFAVRGLGVIVVVVVVASVDRVRVDVEVTANVVTGTIDGL